MSTKKKIATFLCLITVGLAGLTGCRPYKLEAPAGFAEVEKYDSGTHMKGSDDVGLKLSVFDNVKGGTLTFWSHDLVEKLGKRGYVLTGQSAAKSDNGVNGTRFDFEYVAPGTDGPKRFYTAVLFVTDKHRFVLQMAGQAEHTAKYLVQVDDIAGEMKTRGCRSWTKICKGQQPDSLAKLADGTQLASTTPSDDDG